jgi:hypothetical protein
MCIAGGRVHNDREWHRMYEQKRDQGLERLLDYDYQLCEKRGLRRLPPQSPTTHIVKENSVF